MLECRTTYHICDCVRRHKEFGYEIVFRVQASKVSTDQFGNFGFILKRDPRVSGVQLSQHALAVNTL